LPEIISQIVVEYENAPHMFKSDITLIKNSIVFCWKDDHGSMKQLDYEMMIVFFQEQKVCLMVEKERQKMLKLKDESIILLTYGQRSQQFFLAPRIYGCGLHLVCKRYDGSHTFRRIQFQTNGVGLLFLVLGDVGP